MSSPTANNVTFDLKVESAFNTAPSTGSAERFRLVPSPGSNLKRVPIKSNEVRPDQLDTLLRLGSESVPGTYRGELSCDSYDTFLEAMLRSAWVAAAAITEATASLTSITTTTNTIVAGAGSWITAGVRVGDVGRLTGHSTGANNSINLRVVAVTASTITVAGTPLTLNATPDTAFTFTILRKLKNATTPTKRTFYGEERSVDGDFSKLIGGLSFANMKITGGADGLAMIEFGTLAASETVASGASSPFFVTPTEYTTLPLVFVDASIYFGGAAVTTLQSFELNLVTDVAALPVVGSNTTPDIASGKQTLSGTITMLRSDLTNLTRYKAETELELHILLVEPESEPKDCISIYVPLMKIADLNQNGLGGSGFLTETLQWSAGVKPTTTGYDATLLTMCTSAS